MMYDYEHFEDAAENELCETCRFNNVCSAKNKTYTPNLTACACNIALLERTAIELVQENGKIVEKENKLLYSKNFVYGSLLLKRLFRASLVVDEKPFEVPLRPAVKEWLGKYYGEKYKQELDTLPNEKPEGLFNARPSASRERLKQLQNGSTQNLFV